MKLNRMGLLLLMESKIFFLSQIGPLMYPEISRKSAQQKLVRKIGSRKGFENSDIHDFFRAMRPFMDENFNMSREGFKELWENNIIVKVRFATVRFPDRHFSNAHETYENRVQKGLVAQRDADLFINTFIKPFIHHGLHQDLSPRDTAKSA
jgi:hypothetical protein